MSCPLGIRREPIGDCCPSGSGDSGTRAGRTSGADAEQVSLIVIDDVQSELEDRVLLDGRVCFFPPMTGG
jgi:hypothetical protein